MTHLCKYRMTIGRSDSNDLVVDDPVEERMVSSQHAVILHIGNSAMIIDTSLNGTYVNNRRVSRSVLKPNDTVRLGKRRSIDGIPSEYQFVFITKPGPSQSTESSMDVVQVSDLKDALRCMLCRDYIVFPTELLPCSHLFCSSCVETFVIRNSAGDCPHCQTPITSYKARTKFNFVNIIEKALKLGLTDREFLTYSHRMSHRKHELLQRQRTLATLREKQESVQYSPKSGDPFLLVCQTWSAYEKQIFQKGISKYPYGEAREYYCWMVRLTEDWVLKDANKTDISVAIGNLDLLRSRDELSLDEARDALLRFINGKQQASI